MGLAYTAHTPDQIRAMLDKIGVKDEVALYDDVPQDLMLKAISEKLPRPHAEQEVYRELERLANMNRDWKYCVLGAGHYAHYIPAAVQAIVWRSEFYTSYTPYQPEFSQGTLQALFEYQSLITRLTGMDVSNASEYDGGTALGSAIFMGMAMNKGAQTKVWLSPTVHPEYSRLAHTYGISERFSVQHLPGKGLVLDPSDLANLGKTDILVTQYPNSLGYLEDLTAIGAAKEKQGFQWVVISYPMALSVLKSPAQFGADVMVGDGQCFSNGLALGGPTFGYLTAKKNYMRQMPGRMVGLTKDVDGKRGYVLTLQTREQHIRREKATSNICTNQTLNALVGTIYMALLGPKGLQAAGQACADRARLAAKAFKAIDGVKVHDELPYFNEFVVEAPTPTAQGKSLSDLMLDKGILGPYDLSQWSANRKNQHLFAFTELLTADDVETVAQALSQSLLVQAGKEPHHLVEGAAL